MSVSHKKIVVYIVTIILMAYIVTAITPYLIVGGICWLIATGSVKKDKNGN